VYILKTRILAIMAIALMLGVALAVAPITAANEEIGSNEPLTAASNRLYLQIGEGTVFFLSPDASDPGAAYSGYGPTEFGVLMANDPSGFVGMPADVYSYNPVPGYTIDISTGVDALANIEFLATEVFVPVVGGIPGTEPANVGTVTFNIAVSYAGKELASQDFSQQISGGSNFSATLKFKTPSENILFGSDGEFSVSFTAKGGFTTGCYSLCTKGKSYVEFPIVKIEQPVEEQSNENTAENVTAGDSTGSMDQTTSDASAETKTPGFEFLGLACAVGVAVFLVRRKR
jgi:hypothetical protein